MQQTTQCENSFIGEKSKKDPEKRERRDLSPHTDNHAIDVCGIDHLKITARTIRITKLYIYCKHRRRNDGLYDGECLILELQRRYLKDGCIRQTQGLVILSGVTANVGPQDSGPLLTAITRPYKPAPQHR